MCFCTYPRPDGDKLRINELNTEQKKVQTVKGIENAKVLLIDLSKSSIDFDY